MFRTRSVKGWTKVWWWSIMDWRCYYTHMFLYIYMCVCARFFSSIRINLLKSSLSPRKQLLMSRWWHPQCFCVSRAGRIMAFRQTFGFENRAPPILMVRNQLTTTKMARIGGIPHFFNKLANCTNYIPMYLDSTPLSLFPINCISCHMQVSEVMGVPLNHPFQWDCLL